LGKLCFDCSIEGEDMLVNKATSLQNEFAQVDCLLVGMKFVALFGLRRNQFDINS
jgi:hypothetical protein